MRQTLDETLKDLHDQLAEVEDLDQEHVDMLRTALTEIQETLDEQHVSSATLAERLKEASQQFSSSHPLLTNTIGRVADLLSQMGI
ncbi:MAG: DUF4404 family protein [bacterium]|nr:DUF4404 family protein [bacterium]